MNTKCRVWHTIFPGSVPLEEVLYHTEIRGTCLVPASGTTSRPALLLEHPRFARMVESCAPKFAYLLVDAPALSECSDALSLAKVCDGALLVVQSGGVTHQELRQAAHLLQGLRPAAAGHCAEPHPVLTFCENMLEWTCSTFCI